MLGEHPHQGRRAEQLVRLEARDRRVQLVRIGARRTGGIHVRNEAGQAQRRIEQGKRREGREIHATGFDPECGAQHLDLGEEMPMPVDHAFGHAGAAAGEQDRRDVIRCGGCQLRAGLRTHRFNLRQRGIRQQCDATCGDPQRHRRCPAQHRLGQQGQRNPDERHRHCLREALLERALVDARIDQHRHRTELEQCEHHQKELRRRSQHHHAATACDHTARGEARGNRIAARIQLGIGQRDIVASTTPRAANRHPFRAFARQSWQGRGDVAGLVHGGIIACGRGDLSHRALGTHRNFSSAAAHRRGAKGMWRAGGSRSYPCGVLPQGTIL